MQMQCTVSPYERLVTTSEKDNYNASDDSFFRVLIVSSSASRLYLVVSDVFSSYEVVIGSYRVLITESKWRSRTFRVSLQLLLYTHTETSAGKPYASTLSLSQVHNDDHTFVYI